MLTRVECLEAAEDCLKHNKPIYLRNCIRCLADFARVAFAEVALHYTGYQVVKDLPITKRFRLLSSVLPEIVPFEKMFKDIEKSRNKVDHHDDHIPNKEQLAALIIRTNDFQEIFESKVIPRLNELGNTPKEKLREEWKITMPLIEALKQNEGWGEVDYYSVKEEIENIQSILSRLNAINEGAIQETRMRLRELQNNIMTQLDSAEADKNWERGQADYGQWSGK